ncbi:MAG: amidase, partial [Bacilli bacterium]|nr:amidase [Bacilli bacterium]
INPDALSIAASLDVERRTKGPRSLLHGIPVILKDNIDTCDKMHTSAGSLVLKDSYARRDAYVTRLLREAGAIILGKANMTEWANFMTYNMPNGYSSRGGQVLNPYGPGRFDVGGSSSGSAVAVSANLSTVALGTETSGSILSPASQNSCVGLKPTIGLISRCGVIPISHTQDTVGPITRCVTDAAILMNYLVKPDIDDSVTLTNPNESLNYLNYLDRDGLKGVRLGICRKKYFDYLNEEKRHIMDKAIKVIEELGGITKDVVIPSLNANWNINVLLYEFKNGINYYLSTIDPSLGVRTLQDVIRINEENQETHLKYGQTILIEAEQTSGTLTDPEYLNSLQHDIYYAKEQGIDKLLKEENLDVLVFPNNYGAAIPAKAGYPSITVPAGYTSEGEPVGITFTGPAFSEPLLFRVAYAFEQATLHREAPKLGE